MLQFESFPTLADLSRNASVISSSSDSESLQDAPPTPRPRPTRTFSSPRSRSPQSPAIQPIRPPSYLTRELGVSDRESAPYPSRSRAPPRSQSRKRSRSRNPSANNRPSAQDFTFLSTLGEGSYSSVMRARHIRTGQDYAIKILDKNHLIRKDKMGVAMTEKLVLIKLGAGHPGIIHLHWTFQDEWSLFFVLDLAPNGEMQTRISRMGSLSLACARYYTAQIIDALDYMHSKDVIHRDLKPENLLLDADFRIKITDFGTGKILEPGQERANSWVGTAQYISPELLEHGETSKRSDLWSLGCIVYQMIAGRFAFHGSSEYLTWQKVKKLDYTFPEGFDEDAKDFIQKLFVLEPTRRLGAGPEGSPNSRAALRSHPFLAPVKWETLWTDPVPPIETGLLKKEGWRNRSGGAGAAHGQDEDEWEGRWGNVGVIWDALVGGEDDEDELKDELSGPGWSSGGGTGGGGTNGPSRKNVGRGGNRCMARGSAGSRDDIDDDGLRWAEDAEGPEFERFRMKGTNVLVRCEEGDEEAEAVALHHSHAEKQVPDKGTQGKLVIADDSNDSTGEINGTPTTLPLPLPISIPLPTSNEPPFSLPSALALGSDSGSGSGTISSDGSIRRVQQDEKPTFRSSQPAVDDNLVLQVTRLSLGENAAEEPGLGDGAGVGSGSEMRGRDRTLTPVQGNMLYAKNLDWSPILLPGEHVIFHSRVEARSPRRRGSRLRLPLSVVSPTRPKPRELVLTNYRLLCVKRKENSPGGGGVYPSSRSVSTMGSGVGVGGTGTSGFRNGKDAALPSVSFTVKTELVLGVRIDIRGNNQKEGKEKDKESREKEKGSIVESAERKSDREFVVLTSMTSQTYATETSALAAQWIDKINTSLQQYSSPCKR